MRNTAEAQIMRVGKAEISRKDARKEARKEARTTLMYITALAGLLGVLMCSTGAKKENQMSRRIEADSRKVELGSNPCGADIECTLAWLKWKEQETTDKFDVKDQMPVEGTWPNDTVREKPKK